MQIIQGSEKKSAECELSHSLNVSRNTKGRWFSLLASGSEADRADSYWCSLLQK